MTTTATIRHRSGPDVSPWRACFLVGLLGLASPALPADPGTKASLHPAVGAIAPGSTFDVAIQFKLAEGWHIYWQNPGDAGLPPRITWTLPPGFETGALRFPVPRRQLDPGNIVTFVIDGTPVLFQTLTAPKDLPPGGKVTLAAELQWLTCKEACVPEHAALSVAIPVGDPSAELAAADQEVVQRGRRALPLPADQGKHVKASVAFPLQPVKPGQTLDVVLELVVGAGKHIQSNKPTQEAFIATSVLLERDPGLDFGKLVYPPGKERTDPQLGKLSEYGGKVPIHIPAVVREDAEGPRVRIAGIVTTQACDDKGGTCFPPEHLAWGIELPVERGAGGHAAAVPPPASAPQAEVPPVDDAAGAGDRVPATMAADAGSGDGTGSDDDAFTASLKKLGLPGLLLGCFLYGLFINATPCVLPLLSIKVLGFVQQAHESRRRTLMLGVAFGAGVMVFFVVLGLLAARGNNVLQFPAAVIGLGAVVMALALSMLGVYTLQVPTVAAELDGRIGQEGILASFGKGALAPVLGFACTGPLLAGAFGWATQQEPRIAVLAFLATGLGMASPYILLGANPNWLSFLPKPGMWMVTFERIMGFLLLAMVVWLLNPLVTQIGANGLQWTLGFLVVVAAACWLLGKVDFNMTGAQRWKYRGGALTLVLVSGGLIYGWIYPLGEAQAAQQALRLNTGVPGGEGSQGIPWRRWSADAVAEAVRAGKPAFVDITAAWCTVCKVNKKVALETPDVRERLLALGIVPFQADFTSDDPAIAAELRKHGRAGPPLNLIYPAGKPDAPVILRPNLTKPYVLEKLAEAVR